MKNHRYYHIVITSGDMTTMNKAVDSMPYRLRRSLSGKGSGSMSAGASGHAYNCRGSSRRDDIIAHYEKLFWISRRGVTISSHSGRVRRFT